MNSCNLYFHNPENLMFVQESQLWPGRLMRRLQNGLAGNIKKIQINQLNQ